MLRICLALLAGAYALHCCALLPSGRWLLPAFGVALIGVSLRQSRLAAVLLLGFCIAWQTSASVIADRLAPELEGVTLVVAGIVSDFPERRGDSWRFVLQTRDVDQVPARIRLSWYDAPATPRLGETWRLQVRLRRPRGFANPTGFDYEQWLFRQGIGATGYVVPHPSNQRLEHVPVAPRARIRRQIADRIIDVTGDNDASAVLQAITVGARHRITQQQWDRYAVTGTSHLMAISGLHVGLAAFAAWILCRIVFAPVCRWRNLRDIAAGAAVLAASVYASLSGFAVPAERALLMALAVMAAGMLRRQPQAGRIIALAGIAVFLGDPLSILTPGFKLSFAAVAILLWSARQRRFAGVGARMGGRLAQLIYRLPPLQLTLLLGLLPLTAVLFGRVAWLAPFVNLAVLPVFNLVTVPAALLGVLFDGPLQFAGDELLRLSWYSIRVMLRFIGAVADWPPARVHVATAAPLVLPVAWLSALWALLPPGWPGRKLAWMAAASVVLSRSASPPADCVDVTVLDVGQGLAIALRTHRRTAVFDTGPAFRGGGDTGRLVLVPYLRAEGIERIDLLLISHADLDHAGGAVSLISAVDVTQVVAGERLPGIDRQQLRCRRGQAWLWDGVRFALMHPGRHQPRSDNDRSCVLEVAVGRHRTLLTGDIESAVEDRLLATGTLSPVDVVIVPHHGSLTSSGTDFVNRLQAGIAIVSAGFDNRWGLPDQAIVRRWEHAGARVVNTAESGAIRYRMCAGTGVQFLREYRSTARGYWHDSPAP